MKKTILTKIIFISVLMVNLVACASKFLQASDDDTRKIATAKINTQLGMAYLESKNIQHAKQKLLLALNEAPGIPDTWYTMGYFLEVTGDKKQAQKYYLKAVSLAPKQGEVQNNYGTFLCRSGDYRGAIQHFELAAEDINYLDTAATYENAALCSSKIPDTKLAENYFNKSIKNDPERALVYMEFAEFKFNVGQYEESKKLLETYLQLTTPNKESFALSDKLEKKLGKKLLVGEL